MNTTDDFSTPDQSDRAPGPWDTEESGDQGRREWIASQVLHLVRQPTYQPVKVRVLAKRLGLAADERKLLRRILQELARQGKVHWRPGQVVKAVMPTSADREISIGAPLSEESSSQQPSHGAEDFLDIFGERPSSADERAAVESARRQVRSRSDLAVGTFRRAAAGFGFVRPEAEGEGPPPDRQADIFIPHTKCLDAVTGDLVLVRLLRRRGRGARRYGEIVEVVRRQDYRFVGTYNELDGQPVVYVDGRVFSQPIPVSDPTAKGVRPGDQVVIEMVRFPRHYDPGQAVITEVLGPRGAPGVDTLAIIREYDLPGDFPEKVLREAREQAACFDETVGPDRRDLTGELAITIDPEDARDFDDAVSLKVQPDGHWLLGVHIADVAHFVPRGSALDHEARRRGTSVYLPDRVIPMLPEIISNHLASLQPDRIRYTRSVFIEFSPDGIPLSAEIVRSAIRSKRRFNYDEVDDFLEHPAKWRKKLAADVRQLLLQMRDLAMILRRRRLDAGAIELALPEVKILLDDRGRVRGARVIRHTVSHQIIEEFMLAANRAVAETLAQRNIVFLRRIHEPPSPIKLRALTEFVRMLGIACRSLEGRFEIKRVLEKVAGQPTEYAVNYAVLRSMQKAVYSPREIGHYALNWDHYCHFTSPIRRYPDLVIHRMFADWEEGHRPCAQRGELRALGEHCSEREQRAEAAERELVKLKLLYYLHDRIGERMQAVITGVEEFGLFAQGVDIPAEGFISITSLQDDYYRHDRTAHALVGFRQGHRYRLGDTVVVEVAHVDLARRELDFRLLGHAATAPRHTALEARPKTARKSVRSGDSPTETPKRAENREPSQLSPRRNKKR